MKHPTSINDSRLITLPPHMARRDHVAVRSAASITSPSSCGGALFRRAKLTMTATALLISMITARSDAAMIQWSVASGGNEHWYEVVNVSSPITWTAAKDAASLAGGYLATLTTAAEDQFVANLVQANNRNAFLGGYQIDPSAPPNVGWTWVTGEEWAFTNWASGEPNDQGSPNESFLEMWTNRYWNDAPHSGSGYAQYAYVVEVVPAPGVLPLLAAAGLFGRRRRQRASAIGVVGAVARITSSASATFTG